jgi:ribonuclease E
MEKRLGTQIYVVPSSDLETPHYRIHRLRAEEMTEVEGTPSYSLEMSEEEEPRNQSRSNAPTPAEKPAVGEISPSASIPLRPKQRKGLFMWLRELLFGTPKPKKRASTTVGSKGRRSRSPGKRAGGERPAGERGASNNRRGGGRSRSKSTGGGEPRRAGAAKESHGSERPERGRGSTAGGGERGSGSGRTAGGGNNGPKTGAGRSRRSRRGGRGRGGGERNAPAPDKAAAGEPGNTAPPPSDNRRSPKLDENKAPAAAPDGNKAPAAAPDGNKAPTDHSPPAS